MWGNMHQAARNCEAIQSAVHKMKTLTGNNRKWSEMYTPGLKTTAESCGHRHSSTSTLKTNSKRREAQNKSGYPRPTFIERVPETLDHPFPFPISGRFIVETSRGARRFLAVVSEPGIIIPHFRRLIDFMTLWGEGCFIERPYYRACEPMGFQLDSTSFAVKAAGKDFPRP